MPSGRVTSMVPAGMAITVIPGDPAPGYETLSEKAKVLALSDGEELVDARRLKLAHEVDRGLLQSEDLDVVLAHQLDNALGAGVSLVDVAGHDAEGRCLAIIRGERRGDTLAGNEEGRLPGNLEGDRARGYDAHEEPCLMMVTPYWNERECECDGG